MATLPDRDAATGFLRLPGGPQRIEGITTQTTTCFAFLGLYIRAKCPTKSSPCLNCAGPHTEYRKCCGVGVIQVRARPQRKYAAQPSDPPSRARFIHNGMVREVIESKSLSRCLMATISHAPTCARFDHVVEQAGPREKRSSSAV